jgi:hypothetical protein
MTITFCLRDVIQNLIRHDLQSTFQNESHQLLPAPFSWPFLPFGSELGVPQDILEPFHSLFIVGGLMIKKKDINDGGNGAEGNYLPLPSK